jgi:hypothetical protein
MLPWLQGFVPVGEADHPAASVTSEVARWRAPDEACAATGYGGLALDADVAPTPGVEKVLATFSQGVFVVGEDGELVAQAPGFACAGSADELVTIAVGDLGIGEPAIALVATRGGHAESTTWITFYRVAPGGELLPLFTGAVEQHQGATTRTGVVTVIPGGLVYHSPWGATAVLVYDPAAGRYVSGGDIGTFV